MQGIPSTLVDWWRREPENVGAVARTAAAPDGGSSRLAFAGLLALTVVLLAAPQEFIPVLAPFRLALVAAATTAAAHVMSRWPEAGRPRARAPEVVIVACLTGWAIASIPTSMWPGGSIATLTELYLKSVIAFWLIGEIVGTTVRLRVLLWTLSVLIIPLTLTALASFRAGAFSGGRISGYGGGLTGNPNDLALMLNIILPLTGSLALVSRPALRAAAALLAALAAATIIVTFSRAGFVTMMLTGMLFAWLLVKRRHWLPIVLLASVLLCALPFLPSGYLDRVQTVFSVDADTTGSSQERWRDTTAALEFLSSHPLIGAGLGMDILALNEIRGPRWVHVHDVYLNYAVDLGLPGLLLFVALVVASIRSARFAERRGEVSDLELGTYAAGIRISLVGFALSAFFYPTAYQFYFYYLAGLAVAVRRIAASTVVAHEAAPPGVRS